MFFWYIGLSFVLVAWIFASPALDYRLVMLGSVLPLVELIAGGPWFLHTLLSSVVALFVVMLATRGRRLVRRRWLGLPIGLFLYLVLEGAWSRTELFWWPLFGTDPEPLPELKPVGVLVVMEIAGVLALVWAWRRYGFDDPEKRRLFVRSGRLDRSVMTQDPPTC